MRTKVTKLAMTKPLFFFPGPNSSGVRWRKKYLECCPGISGKKSQGKRDDKESGVSLINSPWPWILREQNIYDRIWLDLSMDFFLPFNVEKCNMITQEWEKFMKREGEKLLDVIATRQLDLVYHPSVSHPNIHET